MSKGEYFTYTNMWYFFCSSIIDRNNFTAKELFTSQKQLSGYNKGRCTVRRGKPMGKRAYTRYSLRIPCKMTAETLSGKTPMMEFVTANISAGGAFIETETPLPLASKVRLEFLLALEDLQTLKVIVSLETLKSWKGKRVWISASGIVARHDEAGMGIMFDENYQVSPMETGENATVPS